jgi:glycosyltransferase involved in cell wall biosynthesis
MNSVKVQELKVLMLVPNLPLDITSIKGGVHAAVVNLLSGFLHFPSIKVRLMTLTDEIKEEIVKPYGEQIDIVYVPEGPFPYSSINYLLFGSRKLKQQIRMFKPDLIHYQIGGTLLFTKILGTRGVKYLMTVHGISKMEGKIATHWKMKWAQYLNAFINSTLLPKSIIQISNFSTNILGDEKLDKTEIIPNAIATRYFDIPDKPETSNKLVYVGIISELKNQLFFLDIMRRLKENGLNYHIDFCGGFATDAYEQEFMGFLKSNNLQDAVTLQGWVAHDDIPTYLKKADALVLTSKQEVLPMSIAESMAAGRFAIATAVGGIPEMIDNGVNGYLVSLENPEAVVTILTDLYNNHEKTRLLKEQARKTAARSYHADMVAKKTIEFYQEMLQESVSMN